MESEFAGIFPGDLVRISLGSSKNDDGEFVTVWDDGIAKVIAINPDDPNDVYVMITIPSGVTFEHQTPQSLLVVGRAMPDD